MHTRVQYGSYKIPFNWIWIVIEGRQGLSLNILWWLHIFAHLLLWFLNKRKKKKVLISFQIALYILFLLFRWMNIFLDYICRYFVLYVFCSLPFMFWECLCGVWGNVIVIVKLICFRIIWIYVMECVGPKISVSFHYSCFMWGI